jgi:hypothetical protein
MAEKPLCAHFDEPSRDERVSEMNSERRSVLRLVLDGRSAALDISEQEFRSLQHASAELDRVLDVEEKYDLTIQNYLEFEISVLEEAARGLVQPDKTALENERIRRLLARRLSNILSSARLYLDTLKNYSGTPLLHDSARLKRIQNAQNDEAVSSLIFRFVNEVRNHAQHSSLPVHGLIGDHSDPHSEQITYSVNPYIDVDELRNDKKFDTRILDELEQRDGDVIPLKPVLRSYIESLGTIQKKFRDNSDEPLQLALQLLHDARDRFIEAFPSEGTFALGAVRSNADHEWADIVYLVTYKEGYLEHFKSQAIHMRNFSQRLVEY